MKKRINRYVIIILLVVGVFLYFGIEYLNKEKDMYMSYADFSMASKVMLLNNKDFNLLYSTIRENEVSSKEEKTKKSNLIYNYAKWGGVPILKYLEQPVDNEELESAFTEFLEFYANFDNANIKRNDEIFIKNDDGNNYLKENDYYIYKVKKKVISKSFLETSYQEYLLKRQKESSVENYFIKQLLNYDTVSSKYNASSLKKEIENNYQDFFSIYKDTIVKIITNNLKQYCNYLSKYYNINASTGEVKMVKDIDYDVLELTYKVYKLDRIYTNVSKYYKYSYIVDLDDLWEELDNKGYPYVYC